METRHTLGSLRARSQLSMEEASAKLGMSRKRLARLEADSSRIPAVVLTVMADLYGAPVSSIYLGSAEALAAALNRGTPEDLTPRTDNL